MFRGIAFVLCLIVTARAEFPSMSCVSKLRFLSVSPYLPRLGDVARSHTFMLVGHTISGQRVFRFFHYLSFLLPLAPWEKNPSHRYLLLLYTGRKIVAGVTFNLQKTEERYTCRVLQKWGCEERIQRKDICHNTKADNAWGGELRCLSHVAQQ